MDSLVSGITSSWGTSVRIRIQAELGQPGYVCIPTKGIKDLWCVCISFRSHRPRSLDMVPCSILLYFYKTVFQEQPQITEWWFENSSPLYFYFNFIFKLYILFYCFETGFLFVVLTVLELSLYTRLVWNSLPASACTYHHYPTDSLLVVAMNILDLLCTIKMSCLGYQRYFQHLVTCMVCTHW